MFRFLRKFVRRPGTIIPFSELRSAFGMEGLEDRQLLSGGHHGGFGGGHGNVGSSIAFSLAPAVVQSGLDTLATNAGLADPTGTTIVHLANKNGVETYTVDITGTGTDTKLTVDQLGDPVTAPTRTTTTFGTLGTTDAVAATELSTIATALGQTAPASTATVNVTTNSDGSIVYSLNTGTGRHGNVISVDASGNPVGNETIAFSALPTAIQNGLNALVPTGATALASTSTQNVSVRTVDGVTLYSTKFTASGTATTVTVDKTGAAATLPSSTTTTFGALSTSLQTELQTLAAADGYTGTIGSSQSVTQYNEANGAVIYAVTVSATGTNSAGTTYNFDVTVAVDSNGNPTTPPRGGFGDGGFGGGCGGGFAGVDDSSGSTTGTGSGSTAGAGIRRSSRRG